MTCQCDEIVPEPQWSWTHAVEVEADPEDVWPWIAQLGADRGGFYSYQWLANLVGCDVKNAEAIHPEWAHRADTSLVLHPKMPSLPIASVQEGRSLVAFAAPDEAARAEGRPWATASWAFLVEPLGAGRCRLVSRFRTACSADVVTRLMQGPMLLEPVGFAMDRRMLLGIRDRFSRRRRPMSAVERASNDTTTTTATFLSVYAGAFVGPKRAMAALVQESRRLRWGAYGVAVAAGTYTLVYFFLSRNGGRPTVFTPWLAIDAEVYYRHNLVLHVPSILLAWISAGGFAQLAARAVGGRGALEDTHVSRGQHG